jgi:hypothetical protein
MKKLILLASLAFAAASVANAQCPYARAAAAASSSSRASTSASGGPGFVPSTFVSYSDALTTGQEQLKTKDGVADAARSVQAAKNSGMVEKPALVAQQDDAGNMVISRPHKTVPNPSAKPSRQAALTAVNRQAQVISEINTSSSGRP